VTPIDTTPPAQLRAEAQHLRSMAVRFGDRPYVAGCVGWDDLPMVWRALLMERIADHWEAMDAEGAESAEDAS
jgi:hypothetical protein